MIYNTNNAIQYFSQKLNRIRTEGPNHFDLVCSETELLREENELATNLMDLPHEYLNDYKENASDIEECIRLLDIAYDLVVELRRVLHLKHDPQFPGARVYRDNIREMWQDIWPD